MEKVVSHLSTFYREAKNSDYNDITYTNVITYFKYVM